MKQKAIKIFTLTLCAAALASGLSAQTYRFTGEEWQDPSVGSAGTAPLRAEFISFDTRENCEKGKPENNPFLLTLDKNLATGSSGVSFNIPYAWLDRDVFLHASGFGPYYAKINGRTIGYAEDMHAPAEFNISPWLTDGKNTLVLDLKSDATGKGLESPSAKIPDPELYIYSQPKLRIEDFTIKAGFDSTGKYCILDVAVAVSNSYNFKETFRLGYDLYTPDGKKLIYYDMKDVTLQGGSIDTVRFEEPIYINLQKDLWSAENPVLYRFMLNINYDKRWIEYVPAKIGFGETTLKDGIIHRNGKPLDIKAVTYNATDKTAAAKDLRALKKAGYNTIWPDYPQPIWFYDLCEEIGLYIIEQANINSTYKTDDRTVGGAYSNAPQWLGTFMDRTMSAYTRVASRPSIIAWSLGGKVGNGYNMYKTYQWLKSQGDTRPVIFNDAQGEWNSDMKPIAAADAQEVLAQTAARK